MTTCERLVSLGKVKPNEPNKLLAQSYYELLENKQPILGKKVCVI
jgi:protein phosphatase PTC7